MTINQSSIPVFPERIEKDQNRSKVNVEFLGNTNFGKPPGNTNNTKAPEQENFSKKLFEFTEVAVDEEIEEGLVQNLVGFSWVAESAESLQGKLALNGYEVVKVASVSDRKFFLRNEFQPDWKGVNLEGLSKWFSSVRKFNELDLMMSRTAWVECLGLPMNAWLEENLKAFTRNMGEWVSWSCQMDDSNRFINPLVCLATTSQELISDTLKILVKGKHFNIAFKEVQDIKNYFDDKKLPPPMQEQNENISEENKTPSEAPKLAEKHIKEQSKVGVECINELRFPSSSPSDLQAASAAISSVVSRVPETELASITNIPLENSKLPNSSQDKKQMWQAVRDSTPTDSGVSPIDSGSISYPPGKEVLNEKSQEVELIHISSQRTLCNVVEKLNMGKSRGRPKKRSKPFINPFGRGLSSKINKKCVVKGGNSNLRKKQALKPIMVSDPVPPSDEASCIVESALLMGLNLPLGIEESKKEIAKRLEEGNC